MSDDGSCQYLDALGDCGGDCPGDADGDNVCDNAEIPGCVDSDRVQLTTTMRLPTMLATAPTRRSTYDCDGNVTVAGHTAARMPRAAPLTPDANTDDGCCEYPDALGRLRWRLPRQTPTAMGSATTLRFPVARDPVACNYDAGLRRMKMASCSLMPTLALTATAMSWWSSRDARIRSELHL